MLGAAPRSGATMRPKRLRATRTWSAISAVEGASDRHFRARSSPPTCFICPIASATSRNIGAESAVPRTAAEVLRCVHPRSTSGLTTGDCVTRLRGEQRHRDMGSAFRYRKRKQTACGWRDARRCIRDAGRQVARGDFGHLCDVHEVRRQRRQDARPAGTLRAAHISRRQRRHLGTQPRLSYFYRPTGSTRFLGYPPGGLPRNAGHVELIHPRRPARITSPSVAHMLLERTATMWESRFPDRRRQLPLVAHARIAAHRARWQGGHDFRARLRHSPTPSSPSTNLKRHCDHLAELVEERTVGLERARTGGRGPREASERANLAKSGGFWPTCRTNCASPAYRIISFANFWRREERPRRTRQAAPLLGNIQKSANRLQTAQRPPDLSKLGAGKMTASFNMLDAVLIDEASTETEEAGAGANGVELGFPPCRSSYGRQPGLRCRC